MLRLLFIISLLLPAALQLAAREPDVIVADSVSRRPLSQASVFASDGNFIGICRKNGALPYIPAGAFPVTVRYLGYRETSIPAPGADTVFLSPQTTELPEMVVESRQHRVLHILAYVREYSTLTTFSDSVQLFREKMVDFMLPRDAGTRFRGWQNPRVLESRSYYRFTDGNGLDSVSNRCNYYFSWADWIGLPPAATAPGHVAAFGTSTDTLYGRYSACEIWNRDNGRLTLDVNALADTIGRRWVPGLASFFKKDIDFEQVRLRFNFEGVGADSITPVELSGYSFTVESNDRGRDMFMFNRGDQAIFISTYAEVYIIDKEYITVKEARKWEKRRDGTDELAILEPAGAPELQPGIRELVDRVNDIDNDGVRLALTPDERLVSRSVIKLDIGHRALSMLKTLLGITSIRANRNWNRQWQDFRDRRKHPGNRK